MLPWLLAGACSGGGTPQPTGLATSGSPSDTGDTAASPSCLGSPPTLEIGTGTEVFEPLAELGALEVVFGPQGGFHMTTAVRVCHLDPLITAAVSLVDEASGVTMSEQAYPAPTYDDGDCCRHRADLRAIIDEATLPLAPGERAGAYLDGQVVRIEVQVTDDLGHAVNATRRVTAGSAGTTGP